MYCIIKFKVCFIIIILLKVNVILVCLFYVFNEEKVFNNNKSVI